MGNWGSTHRSSPSERGLTEIILLAKAGNREAMAEIYARFEPLIIKLARTVNVERMEDAKHELVIELLDAVARFEPVVAASRTK